MPSFTRAKLPASGWCATKTVTRRSNCGGSRSGSPMVAWSRCSKVLRPAIAWSPRAVSSSIAWRRARRRSVADRTQRHERDRRLFAQAARPHGGAVRDDPLRRGHRVPRAQHRGLSRSHAADGGCDHAKSRPVGGRDRALHHHSDRSERGYRPPPHCNAHYLPLRPLGREAAVLIRLSQMPALPNNAQPQISPVSPIGEIYRYRLVGPPGYSVLDLKTLQDWVIARRFRAVSGVIDVTGWGGKTKTFEIQIDRDKLVAFGLTLPQVLQTLSNSNINVGGNTVNIGQQSAVVRGVGLIRSMNDIRNTMLTAANGTPVFLSDIAEVVVGNKPRLGIAGRDEQDDIVQGIVLMRRGQQSLPTIRRVEEEVEKINTSGILPPGVHIERIYDRSDLISLTTHTVLFNLVFGMILVFFVQWIFLGDLRSALIVSSTIPFALFFAMSILVLRGESANLLSVGAIDFGLIVDATVIMVENIFRHLAEGAPLEEGAEAPASYGLRGK